jgi:hypothetical protein
VAVLAVAALGGSGGVASHKSRDAWTGTRASLEFARVPLSFEPNVGQSDRHVRFISRRRGATLFFTSREAVLAIGGRRSNGAGAARLALQFVGTVEPVIAGVDRRRGKINYFLGRDRSRWHAGVPTYGRVRYAQLWPGIDASFYGVGSRLEYDLELSPGADPRKIVLRFSGARRRRIDSHGALLLAMPGGEQVQVLAPVAYQRVKGRRRPVESHFVDAGGVTRIEVGPYDHHRPLTVDPGLVYSTYLGGSGPLETGNGIAVDGAGEAYVTGFTESLDFPPPGSHQGGGGADAFVTKLNAAGSGLVFTTYVGGEGTDIANRIALDSAGNAYVAGETYSRNFTTTPGAAQEGCGDPECTLGDAFVTKLSPTGTVIYSTLLGGNAKDAAYGIAVDRTGSAHVVGETHSTKGMTTPKAKYQSCADLAGFEPPCALGDAFLTKLNAAGSERVFSTYLGGEFGDLARAVAVDAAGNAYVTGITESPEFPHTEGVVQPKKGGENLVETDAFVSKFNSTGEVLLYSTFLGGSKIDIGDGIAVNERGEAYVTGFTTSPDFPTARALQPHCGGSACSHFDAFVSRLTAAGDAFVYSTYLGGSGQDFAHAIAVDSAGAAYVTGSTTSKDFPVSDAAQPVTGGREDAFLTKLDAASGALVYSSYLGGSGVDSGSDVAVDPRGAAYLTGYTSSATDFPLRNPLQPKYGGERSDVFVAKFAPPDVTAPTSTITPPLCKGPAIVTVTDDSEGSGPHAIHFRLDGGAERSLATSDNPGVAAVSIPEGTHTLEYWGEDAAGNLEASHHVATMQIDSTPPEVSITSDQHLASYEIGDHASVAIAAHDATSGTRPYPSHESLVTNTPGRRTATIDVIDRCGNSGRASFAYTVIPDPVLGRTINLEPRSGVVYVNSPKATASRATIGTARGLTKLTGALQVPVGTIVDATAGALAVTAVTPRGDHHLQTGTFQRGRFTLLQRRSEHGLVELRLIDSITLRGCVRGSHSSRGLVRADVSGRFRTSGHDGRATAHGPAAAWSISDRCDGTLIHVTRGRVLVRSLHGRRHQGLLVRAGRGYLAHAR